MIKYQMLAYVGGASGGPVVCSAPFGANIQQIRISSSVAGYASIDQSTSGTLVSSTSIPAGATIPNNTIGGEYVTVTQGQLLSFCSTSTSSGNISVVECA
jgi:hypothetical protein